MSNKNELCDDLVIPKGTIIKFNGVPFSLVLDTQVQGLKANLEYAKNYENMPKVGDPPPRNGGN